MLLAAVETRLLGPGGPIKVLTPELVGGMDDEALASLAAETSMTSSTRAELAVKAGNLKAALALAKEARF